MLVFVLGKKEEEKNGRPVFSVGYEGGKKSHEKTGSRFYKH